MSRSDQAGFTLIELIIVMAITSALLVIAFVGQRSLRSRAQFDADVDKIVASVAAARSEAAAGVNTSTGATAGTGVNNCPGGAGVPTVFAGEAWTADSSIPGSAFEVEYYKANPGTAACIYDTRSISVPSDVTVSGAGGRELFVRTATGDLDACPWTNLTAGTELPSFENGSCASGTLTINLQDADGHTSQIVIDSSGLARRVN